MDCDPCGIGECRFGWAVLRQNHPWHAGLNSHKQEASNCGLPHKGGPQTVDSCSHSNSSYDHDVNVNNIHNHS
jgi:hypothetical protein